jgi:TldD protein
MKLVKPIKLADVKPVKDRVILKAEQDLRETPLDKKALFLTGLNSRVSKMDSRVISTRLLYTDSVDNVFFRNSEGTELDVTLPEIETNFWVTSREKGNSQWARNRRSAKMGFEFTSKVDLDEQGKDAVTRSIDLLKGKPTPKGKQTIIMDPSAVGVFIHEAFGHANEADSVSQRRSFLYGLIGKKIASEHVTLYCDPTLPEEVGSYPYDSEGTPARYTVLVDRGTFRSHMHSRETAAEFGVEPTGNARAQDFSLPPIVRMNNLCLKRGDWKFGEMVADTKNGILVEGSRGGMEDPERGGFQFSAQNCYLIKNGEVVSPLKDVSISGMTIDALKSVDAVADNFYLHPGHCGKGEPGVMQSITCTDGGPYIRVNDILVGGSS